MAVQVVGTLLLFALVVTPAATALRITARPVRVAALAVAIALASVWGGLVLSAMVDLPPSFFIVSLAVLAWVAVLVATGRRTRPAARPRGHPPPPLTCARRERDLSPCGVDHPPGAVSDRARRGARSPHGRHAARRPGRRGLLQQQTDESREPRVAGHDRRPHAGQPPPRPPGLSPPRGCSSLSVATTVPPLPGAPASPRASRHPEQPCRRAVNCSVTHVVHDSARDRRPDPRPRRRSRRRRGPGPPQPRRAAGDRPRHRGAALRRS